MITHISILTEKNQLSILDYIKGLKSRIDANNGVIFTSSDYHAKPNEVVKVFTGGELVTITLPYYKEKLVKPVMFEIEDVESGKGGVDIVVNGDAKIGKSEVYHISKRRNPIRVITNGGDYVIF